MPNRIAILADAQAVGIAHAAQMSEYLAEYDQLYTPDYLSPIDDQTLIDTFGNQFQNVLNQDDVYGREKRRQLTAMYNALNSVSDQDQVTIMGLDQDVIDATNGLQNPDYQAKLQNFGMYRHVETFAGDEYQRQVREQRKLDRSQRVEIPRDDMWKAMIDDGIIDSKKPVANTPQFSTIPGTTRSGITNLALLEGHYQTSHQEVTDEIVSTKLQNNGVQSLNTLNHLTAFHQDENRKHTVLTGQENALDSYNEFAQNIDNQVPPPPLPQEQMNVNPLFGKPQQQVRPQQQSRQLTPIEDLAENEPEAPQQPYRQLPNQQPQQNIEQEAYFKDRENRRKQNRSIGD